MLLDVSYELLKLEATTQDNKIVDQLLNGHIKPDILRVLITSNKYNVTKDIVEPKEGVFFKLEVGSENKLLQYSTINKKSDKSIHIKKDLQKNYDDRF